MNLLDSLEDAWRWYQDTRIQMKLLRRLASAHWDALPWDGQLGKDSSLHDFSAEELVGKANFSLPHLDDLAIVVMFSIFESEVRQRVLEEVAAEEKALKHRAIRWAVARAKERIETGSFFSVLEPFKDRHHDLVAQIDQVRDYRNWVAHGRRGNPRNHVDPKMAYDRLRRFLQILESPT
jgi:hypothetical protein